MRKYRILYNPKEAYHKKSCGCLKSYGEKVISNILQSNNIIFEREKTFEGCINFQTGHRLRFDFYLPEYNICIEYDGEQHFFSNNRNWNTEDNLKETKYRDNLKDSFCNQNNIRLIRIPYTELANLHKKDYLTNIIRHFEGEDNEGFLFNEYRSRLPQ